MARSLTDIARLNFLAKVDGLERYIGRGNQGLADILGCSAKTISNMKKDPFSVSGRYILMTEIYYERERKKSEI